MTGQAKERIVLSWSGGKDSAMALHELQKSGRYEIEALITTVSEEFDRVCMHGVRKTLLRQQAVALGLPLYEIRLPSFPTNALYEERLSAALRGFKAKGIDTAAFGDLFLADLKTYRGKFLAGLGMKGLYPIWLRDTRALVEEFIDLGFKAALVCIDPKVLPESFAGRLIDRAMLNDLPANVDPCGENGEYHSFVFDGPNFHHPVSVELGERVRRDGFVYCDLLPAKRPPEAPRIVSFLPAATEMVYALGLGDRLFGVSHECDFPPEAKTKPVVVRNTLDLAALSPNEIDTAVSGQLRNGGSLYTVDETLLKAAAPTLLLTQNLCQVCAPSGNEMTKAVASLPEKPEVLWMTPTSLAEIDENIRSLGAAAGRATEAEQIVSSNRRRMGALRSAVTGAKRPRVFFMEWVDPLYCGGHWVPEMIEIAGGDDRLARKGTDSVRISWEDVVAWAPEIVVVSPCGYDLAKALEQIPLLEARPEWKKLPAVQSRRVFVVDANSYFARPGPRVIDGIELLAHLFHPDRVKWTGGSDAFRRVDETAYAPR